MSENITFVQNIKNQLLAIEIKPECCKQSFITGTEVFARSRKNEFTDAINEYKKKLIRKKKKAFFEDDASAGYVTSEESGKILPVSSGRICPSCFAHLLRGAFLVCGRASRSEKNLHVEMVMPSEEAKMLLSEYLTELDFVPKEAHRRGEILIYYKKYETVEDLLTYIGASATTLDLMNSAILSELRTSVNRQRNCDTGNIQKTVDAAKRQTDAIKAIMEFGSLSDLPPTLRQTAEIRLEHPLDQLDDITEYHGGEISRSGVNHRLSKIVKYAEKMGYLK